MILFYNLDNISEIKLKYPDVYFTPEYGKCCQYSDNAKWELCKYKDLIYVYLKRPIIHNNVMYYDLITPYGYSGYYYKNTKSYAEFIPLFRKEAINRNYITEVVRQIPYLNIDILNYDVITSKSIYGININSFDEYYKNILNGKKRNMYTKAVKNNFIFELEKLNNKNIKKKFVKLYYENMKDVKANDYYLFNDMYFKSLECIDDTYLAIVKNVKNIIIGISIILKHNDYIHYHLSCNNKSSNCITDFLLINLVKEFGNNKLIILGSGLKENDSLSKFKKKLCNKEYKYTIYKNILNKKIYDELSTGNEINNYFPCYKK
jgi:hypothetical protein